MPIMAEFPPVDRWASVLPTAGLGAVVLLRADGSA